MERVHTQKKQKQKKNRNFTNTHKSKKFAAKAYHTRVKHIMLLIIIIKGYQ